MQNPTEIRHAIEKEALNALLRALDTKRDRCMLVMPPRFGAEAICAQFIRLLMLQGGARVLCLSDRLAALERMHDACKQYMPDRKIVMFKDTHSTADVVCATYQAMAMRPPEHAFEVVICLDCDRAGAESFRLVVEALIPKRMRIGVTCSPIRYDGQDVHDLFGEAVFTLSLGEVQRRGALAIDYENVLDTLEREGEITIDPSTTIYAEQVHSGSKRIPNRDRRIALVIQDIILSLSAKRVLVVTSTPAACDELEKLIGGNALAFYDNIEAKPSLLDLLSAESVICIVANILTAIEDMTFDVVILLHKTAQLGTVVRQVSLGIHTDAKKPLIVRDFAGSYQNLIANQRRRGAPQTTSPTGRQARGTTQPEVFNLPSTLFDFTAYPVSLAALEKKTRGIVQEYTFAPRGRIPCPCRLYRFATDTMTREDNERLVKALSRFKPHTCGFCYVSLEQAGQYAILVFIWMLEGIAASHADTQRLLSIFRRLSWLARLEWRPYDEQSVNDDIGSLLGSFRLSNKEPLHVMIAALLEQHMGREQAASDIPSTLLSRTIAPLQADNTVQLRWWTSDGSEFGGRSLLLITCRLTGEKRAHMRTYLKQLHAGPGGISLTGDEDTLLLALHQPSFDVQTDAVVRFLQTNGISFDEQLFSKRDAYSLWQLIASRAARGTIRFFPEKRFVIVYDGIEYGARVYRLETEPSMTTSDLQALAAALKPLGASEFTTAYFAGTQTSLAHHAMLVFLLAMNRPSAIAAGHNALLTAFRASNLVTTIEELHYPNPDSAKTDIQLLAGSLTQAETEDRRMFEPFILACLDSKFW